MLNFRGIAFLACFLHLPSSISEECHDALGIESKYIPDAQITASSEHNSAHGASNARLNFQAGGGKSGAWSALVNDPNQWLQVDLGRRTNVTGIKTQGRQDADQWVMSYTVSYSDDGTTFTGYKQNEILQGNSDRDTVVSHILSPLINVLYIRVHPKEWYVHISMRMELLGCPSECQDALPDAQITASSEYNSAHGASNARLNFQGGGGKTAAWSALVNDPNQWLQVDLGKRTNVTLIRTQGRQDADQWVTSYTVSYSDDGTTFTAYKQNAILQGNSDRQTIVSHILSPLIDALYIRIHPKEWYLHISMRMELLGCPLECQDALGMESNYIPDAQITASSEHNSAHGASNARLNFQGGGGKTGAWSALVNNPNQWLQVDLGRRTKVTLIKTQGRQDADQWVTSYTVSYCDDGTTFTGYKQNEILQGNSDRDTVVSHILSPLINALYIRVHPKEWYLHISMRMELLGCPLECQDALGMESKYIPDAQITASSEHNSAHGASNARLNFQGGGGKTGAWSALVNNRDQWLQVDLGQRANVTVIRTQGRQDADQWVTSYTVSYSDDDTTFTGYKQNEILQGNTDRHTVVSHILSPALSNAVYIRVHPKQWYLHISMRMELLGCPSECQDALGMESNYIPDAQITASSEHGSAFGASNARLNFQAGGGKTGAWSALINDPNQWLQVDLGRRTNVTGIKTQGRQGDYDQWVTSYTVSYSDDGTTFTAYKQNAILQGNSDRDTVISHVFSPLINARYIRVHPKQWFAHISMRMELLGCLSG